MVILRERHTAITEFRINQSPPREHLLGIRYGDFVYAKSEEPNVIVLFFCERIILYKSKAAPKNPYSIDRAPN